MNCDGVRPLLSAYIDQELSGGELLRVERHLRRCHWCAAEVDALRQTVALVASLDEVELPATFHAELHQRLISEDPPIAKARRAGRGRSRLPSFRRWAIPAAAAAALVIGVAGLNRLAPPEPQAEPRHGDTVAVVPDDHVATEEVPGTVSPPDTSDVTEQPHHPVNGPEEQPPSSTGGVNNQSDDPLTEQPEPGAPGAGETDLPPASGEEGPADPPTPLGPTRPGSGVTTASVSGETGEQGELPPEPQFSAMAEVTVANPGAEAEQVRMRLAQWRVRENGRIGTVELQIFVPADDFQEAVALVNSELSAYGAQLAVQEKDVASQLAETAERIAALAEERDALAARLEGEGGEDRLEERELAEQELAELEQQLATERTNYENLREAVETSVIVLTFKPQPAQ